MKTIYKILASALAVLFLSSCSGLLEEHNMTGISDPCCTESALESGILGIQAAFVSWNGLSGMGAITLDYTSGLSAWVNDKWFLNEEYYANLNFTALVGDQTLFPELYAVIAFANGILGGLPDSPVDEAYKLEIEAEARFYRAVAYFYLVRIYGDCPLRMHTPRVDEATSCPRSPYYTVYEKLVEDLLFAYENMRSPQRVAEATPGCHRPNRYAAIAYLSNVYCTIGSLLASPDDNFWNPAKEDRVPDFSAIGIAKGDYQAGARQAYEKALEYAEMLIPESPRHDAGCQYRLVEKFGDLFAFDPEFSRNGYDAHLNPEQIFSIIGTITSSIASPYVQYRLPQYAEGTSATVENANAGRVRPNRYFYQKWCETYPGQLKGGSDYYLDSADPRLDLSFYHSRMNKTIGGTQDMYPLTNGTTKAVVYAYYKKTASKRGTNVTSDADVVMMRLAQVYLIAAEAAAYLGDEATARKYIEVLHARARHSVADGEDDSAEPSWEGRTFASREELLDAIFWENEFELAGESQDHFIVHRHGARWIIKNICIPMNADWARPANVGVRSAYYPDFEYPEDYNADPTDISGDVFKIRKSLLYSFPNDELNYNSGISVEQAKNDYNYDR